MISCLRQHTQNAFRFNGGESGMGEEQMQTRFLFPSSINDDFSSDYVVLSAFLFSFPNFVEIISVSFKLCCNCRVGLFVALNLWCSYFGWCSYDEKEEQWAQHMNLGKQWQKRVVREITCVCFPCQVHATFPSRFKSLLTCIRICMLQ